MKRLRGITTLITDADNTLYSWIDYIVPCLEAMVDTLCRQTGLPQDDIVRSIKQIFERHSTNEYAFVLQEADVFAEMRKDFNRFQEEVINPTRYAFNRVRHIFLKLYPGVRRTLGTLVRRGVRVIVLSDAPLFSAEQRLKHLDIARYIYALYALKSYAVPASSMLDRTIINRIRAGYYRSRICKIVELPLQYEKPSVRGIEQILRDENLDPERTALVGDNPKKDMRVARETGIADIWARYGTRIAPDLREKLNYYSAASIQRRNVSQEGETSCTPTYVIDSFDELLNILES